MKKLSYFYTMLATSLMLMIGSAQASEINLTKGVTSISESVYQLHMLIFYICCVIGAIVFSIMFYALIKHRKSVGHEAQDFHESTVVEILWTIVPFVILIAMAVPATKVLLQINDTKDSEMTVKVTGYQWKWQYEYMDEGVSFFSNLATSEDAIQNKVPKGEHYLKEVDNPLVLPVNTKVRFLFTANDVIHSWWVPALGFKKDTVPGFINENWTIIEQPGTYRGQCAELCGVNHGYMPIVVEALSKEDFKAWLDKKKADAKKERELAAKKWTMDELMVRGEKTYLTYCAACHQKDGKGTPLFASLVGSPIATGPVAEHLKIVLQGRAGTMMQGFGAQLSETDIAAVVTYERNAWGNKVGDVVQPIDVKRAKDSLTN